MLSFFCSQCKFGFLTCYSSLIQSNALYCGMYFKNSSKEDSASNLQHVNLRFLFFF